MTRKPALLILVPAVALSMGASDCGDNATRTTISVVDGTTTTTEEVSERCMDGSAAAEHLELKGSPAAMIKTDIPGGPLDLPQNRPNYYVAVDGPKGIAVWATEQEWIDTGGGIIISADGTARRTGNFGDLVDAVSMGIGRGDPDYDLVIECLEEEGGSQ